MIETGDNMDGDFEDLKEQNGVDNSELEEIMKREITPESQREFLEILKDSQLFMPVIYSDNYFHLMPGESRTISIEWKAEDARGCNLIVEITGMIISKTTVKL